MSSPRRSTFPRRSIQRVAREFAERRPSVAVGDSPDGALTAIYALNALVGAFGRQGGIFFGADDLAGPGPGAGIEAPAPGPEPRFPSQEPQPRTFWV